jgi:hypothetical protein
LENEATVVRRRREVSIFVEAAIWKNEARVVRRRWEVSDFVEVAIWKTKPRLWGGVEKCRILSKLSLSHFVLLPTNKSSGVVEEPAAKLS